MPEFSVLLSVYGKEVPDFLDEALRSLERQSLIPDEIVVVKDGPLTPELEKVLERHVHNGNGIPYRMVQLAENRGLGEALNAGLKYCRYPWVARMDTDDIATEDRFAAQMEYLQRHPELDILGGWICEFDEADPAECARERRVPETHEAIVRFAKYRNPMNHMTVIFRKEAVEEAGGYRPMPGMEDYYLWMRMLQRGKRFANLPRVLVRARAGRAMLRRRQGLRYAGYEWRLAKAAHRIGFWSAGDLSRNFFLRFLPRLLPLVLVEKLYNQLRKQ